MPHLRFDILVEKIRERRKSTPFHEFVREICSWKPVAFYRNGGQISRFPVSDRIQITDHETFDEERDTLLKYGISYSVEQGFTACFQSLLKSVPLMPTIQFFANENATYADIVHTSKNVYLSFAVIGCENILYSESIKSGSRNVIDSFVVVDGCENIYASSNIYRSSQVFVSRNILDSRHIWYCHDMQGCHDCIGCSGLENQSYCIDNTRLTKEDYLSKKQEVLGHMRNNPPLHDTKSGINFGSEKSNGIGVVECHDATNAINTYRLKEARNVVGCGGPDGDQRFYDVFSAGGGGGDDFYGVFGGGTNAQGVYCSSHINGGSMILYSYFCQNSSFVLGCVGLKNQSYCIFNRQYSAEEWHTLAEQILSDMESAGTLGAFFAPEINPFYYNDTMAALLGSSVTRQEALKMGYLWRDETFLIDIPVDMEVLSSTLVHSFETWTDGKVSIDTGVLSYAFRDEDGDLYRITEMEKDFYERFGLSLPTLAPLKRLKKNIPQLI